MCMNNRSILLTLLIAILGLGLLLGLLLKGQGSQLEGRFPGRMNPPTRFIDKWQGEFGVKGPPSFVDDWQGEAAY